MFLENADHAWGLHEHRSPSANGSGKCLVFVIDPRFVILPGIPDTKFRLAVTYGDNPFTPEMACGFVPPPVRPGKYVFGIHDVGLQGNQISVYDQWYDAREAPPDMSIEQAANFAREILKSIDDSEYAFVLKESREDVIEVQREEVSDIEKLTPYLDG